MDILPFRMTRAVVAWVAVLLLCLGAAASAATDDTVTIQVRPTVLRFGQKPDVFGYVSSGKAGEKVTVQFKQCRLYPLQFRDYLEATTVEGGSWSHITPVFSVTNIQASGELRAVWGEAVSAPVSMKVRPLIQLVRHRSGGRWHVRVAGTQSFWRRRVLLERFDRGRGTWVLIRSLALTESSGYAGGGSPLTGSSTEPFRPGVPKGTTIRAVLPLAAARPCYLAGYSTLQRT